MDDPLVQLTVTNDLAPIALADAIFVATSADAPDLVAEIHRASAQALILAPAEPPSNAPNRANVCRFVPFQPMQLRALTEIIPLPETSDTTLKMAALLAHHIGRKPVILPRGASSAGLRLMDRFYAEADRLLLQGAVLWELDEAMVKAGFDPGPYEAQDLIGLDVAYARRRALGQPSLIADRAVEEGRIGKKIGWGWYRYPGGGGAVIDPLIEDLIREEAWFAKIDQRTISADDIVATLTKALIAEARCILAEGSVSNPSDLDTILAEGLGFPASLLPHW
jgi:3-hydroxyacyl-CoA dehydrogenase